MLTLQDCIDFLGLSADEVDAIAEHEHCSPIIAAELASYLIESEQGERSIRRMIIDDIEAAEKRGDDAHADRLMLVLKHFVATHPDLY